MQESEITDYRACVRYSDLGRGHYHYAPVADFCRRLARQARIQRHRVRDAGLGSVAVFTSHDGHAFVWIHLRGNGGLYLTYRSGSGTSHNLGWWSVDTLDPADAYAVQVWASLTDYQRRLIRCAARAMANYDMTRIAQRRARQELRVVRSNYAS